MKVEIFFKKSVDFFPVYIFLLKMAFNKKLVLVLQCSDGRLAMAICFTEKLMHLQWYTVLKFVKLLCS